MRLLSTLAVAASFAAPAAAQVFAGPDPAEQVRELGRRAAIVQAQFAGEQGAATAKPQPSPFAVSVVCPAAKGTYFSEGFKLYTRLGSFASVDALPAGAKELSLPYGGPGKDETGFNDYWSASVGRDTFRYSSWSCDTQDYYFTIATKSLARASADVKSAPVTVHARVETRGSVDFEGDLACTANW